MGKFARNWIAAVAALCGGGGASAADSPTYSEKPPPAVQVLIDRIIRGGDQSDSAIDELGKIHEAAPYLRLIPDPALAQRDYRRDINKALAKIEGHAQERKLRHYRRWAESGRFDLCAELLATIKDEEHAAKLADLTLPIRERMAGRLIELTSFDFLFRRFGPQFIEPLGHRLLKFIGDDIEVSVPAGRPRGVLVIARTCKANVFLKENWFVVATDHLEESITGEIKNGVWEYASLLVNNNEKFGRVDKCLIVCDGDIELHPSTMSCIVIANGNITSEKGAGGGYSYLISTGDIRLPNRTKIGTSHFHAGGTIQFDGNPIPASEQVKEKQTSLPFGIKFLDPKEFGLDLAVQNGGVQVTGLTPESPFAKYGVQDADVITKIDDVAPKTLPDFRRALRRGVIRESVVLHIKREGKMITRIVFLDGVPLPIAPTPRHK